MWLLQREAAWILRSTQSPLSPFQIYQYHDCCGSDLSCPGPSRSPSACTSACSQRDSPVLCLVPSLPPLLPSPLMLPLLSLPPSQQAPHHAHWGVTGTPRLSQYHRAPWQGDGQSPGDGWAWGGYSWSNILEGFAGDGHLGKAFWGAGTAYVEPLGGSRGT